MLTWVMLWIDILGFWVVKSQSGADWERYSSLSVLDISVINISPQGYDSTTRKSTSEGATFWHRCASNHSLELGDWRHPDVPDFTPLARRSTFRWMTRPALPTPIVDNAPFQDLAIDVESTRQSASLLAPHYSHL